MDTGNKKIYYLAAFIGSALGGYIPTFFGVGLLSLWSIFWSATVALLFIYVAYKLLG